MSQECFEETLKELADLQKQRQARSQWNIETKILTLLYIFSLSLPWAVRLMEIQVTYIIEKGVQEEECVEHFSDKRKQRVLLRGFPVTVFC